MLPCTPYIATLLLTWDIRAHVYRLLPHASQAARLLKGLRLNVQEVKANLPTPPENVLVLPFDLCGSYSDLEQAAAAADSAFGGAGVDYLMHNAGA